MDSQNQTLDFGCKEFVAEKAIDPDYVREVSQNKDKQKAMDMTKFKWCAQIY